MIRYFSRKQLSSFRNIPIEGLLGLSILLIAINLFLTASIFEVGTLFLISILAIAILLDVAFPDLRWQKSLRRLVYGKAGLSGILLLGFAVLAFDYFAVPVRAQFMNQAESWMTGVFPDAGEVIPLVFNVLRGILLLYVGVAVVRVINAAREEEDWKSLARTPLIVVIAVAVADILVGIIVGGAGGGGGP